MGRRRPFVTILPWRFGHFFQFEKRRVRYSVWSSWNLAGYGASPLLRLTTWARANQGQIHLWYEPDERLS